MAALGADCLFASAEVFLLEKCYEGCRGENVPSGGGMWRDSLLWAVVEHVRRTEQGTTS
jgi:hypothetical protein